jgi:methionine-S-sulfoxide reductase
VTSRKLALYAFALVALVIAEGVFRYFMRTILIGMSREVEYELRNDIFRHFTKLAPSYYQEHRTGDLMSRATNDLTNVRLLFGFATLNIVNTVLVFGLHLPLMLMLDPKLSLAALVPYPVLFVFLGLVALSVPVPAQETSSTRTAIFAGGCFWCMQPEFDRTSGVVKTTVGYTGGKASDANYPAVSSHRTQHREAIEVTYDPARVSYEKLLAIYWSNIDPTQADGQFADIGLSYQAAIYYGNDEEKKIAEVSKEKLGNSGKFDRPIVTEILPAKPFYPAEDYHQKYYLKNPADYEAYHVGSGRVGYLEKIWGNP